MLEIGKYYKIIRQNKPLIVKIKEFSHNGDYVLTTDEYGLVIDGYDWILQSNEEVMEYLLEN